MSLLASPLRISPTSSAFDARTHSSTPASSSASAMALPVRKLGQLSSALWGRSALLRESLTASHQSLTASQGSLIPPVRSFAAAKDTKVTKDTGEDKRPLSAYLRYSVEQRSRVIEENPGITFGQVGKVLGERWRALSDAEKKPYVDAYNVEKALYDERNGKKGK